MKKIIILILTLALCLSLAACDGGETPNTNENNGTNQENNNGANNETTESPYANHPHLAYIYGQWELREKESYSQPISCRAVTINEDGTCVVDGVSGTWEISNETRDDFLKINFFIEGEHRFVAAYYSDPYFSIGVWSADYPGGAVDACWINMTTTEAITLTTENWRDYFELVTESEYRKDAFGDFETLVLVQYLTLKEEYAKVIYEDDVVVEIASTANRYYITLDAANESYTLGEMIEEVALTAEVKELYQYSSLYLIDVFGNNYINVKDNANSDSEGSKKVILVSSIEDIEFLRVKGTIYVVKP